jgi:hypothetical protein
MSVYKKLTEGLVDRNLRKEGAAVLDKWESTGLLEGLDSPQKKRSMARLLENEAKEVLRLTESSSMAGGDVEGFAAVAFPMVRRIFGSLVANDLVSVQPMSLPSGLIFFLDFTHSDSTASRLGGVADASIYGGGVVASELTGGVSDIKETGGGFYNLANAYSSPTGSVPVAGNASTLSLNTAQFQISSATDAQLKTIQYDPDLVGTSDHVLVLTLASSALTSLNKDLVTAVGVTVGGDTDATLVRRLTRIDVRTGDITLVLKKSSAFTDTAADDTYDADNAEVLHSGASHVFTYPKADAFAEAGLGAVVGTDNWGLEGANDTGGAFNGKPVDQIPEIDIKVDSIAVSAMTKKLKAKWTPELGQDLQAYHNLDAEVELTGILSEQIALEIDREILNDLIQGATAGTYYWSRRPGRFVDRGTGSDISSFSNESLLGADFTGTVSEWYETLLETVNDISAQIHRKVLRGGANFIVIGPETANILEFTSGFRASVTHDSVTGTTGAVKIGSMSKKFDVYVDPYFPRNLVLVGRNGGSFLESGYVYAPYVPLQTTPTIFGVEDFVPRKGVMTRYAKKMVRPDMYGLVVIKDFLG